MDDYICPAGKLLRTTGRVHDGGMLRYRAEQVRLRSVPMKAEVLPKDASAQVPRDVHEDARDLARAR